MEREPFEGTPSSRRATAYVYPIRNRRLLIGSIVAAAVIVVGAIGLYFSGARRTLSPGPLTSQHAGFEVKCAQCHDAGNAVAAVRCERCHDPSNSQRLTHAAHILIGTSDPAAVAKAEERPCQSCHIEHRGRTASLHLVDNRECGSCHRSPAGSRLTSFDRHPEFAVVTAGATPAVGIDFTHQRHLQETQRRRGGETCSVCHEPTTDRRGFAPIVFERHCSGCHLDKGVLPYRAEGVDMNQLVPPAALPASILGDSKPVIVADETGEATISGLRHRDPWVMYNLRRLRTGIDPNGDDAERLTLRAQAGYLDALLRSRPSQPLSPTELERAIATLQADIAKMNRPATRTAAEDAQALAQLASAATDIARQTANADPTLTADFTSVATAPGPMAAQPAAPAATDAAEFERRKTELQRLLDAVAKRAGEAAVAKAAKDLRAQVDRLMPTGNTATDRAPLLDRLNALDGLLRALRTIPDAGLLSEVARVDLERRYGQQQLAGGLTPDDFDGRRRQLLNLLDAIEQRGDEVLRLQAATLRQRALAVRPGGVGDDAALRRTLQRQLDRLRLELEFERSPRDREPTPAAQVSVDRSAVSAQLARIQSTLSALDAIPAMEPPTDADRLDDRQYALRSLLSGTCSKCHVIDTLRGRMAPVRIAEPVMPHSVFNHAPHVTRVSCESCHGARQPNADPATANIKRGSIWTSTAAVDVNVPGKALCATCHTPGKTRDTCETCHVFHAASPASLVSLQP